MQVNAHAHPQPQPQQETAGVGNSTVMLHPQNHNLHHFSTLSSPSIYFRVFELFHERLNIKICPIRLGPFSKAPLDIGWTSDDYDPTAISWARHPGNIGIIPGRSNLLIIDCDTQESVLLFTELAIQRGLKLPTLEIKTRRGYHYYYYCSFSERLEKKQFTDNSRNIKIDLLAGNKCQVVAPYSQLKVKTENGEKIILDPKTNQDFELLIYEPTHIPESLPSITEEQYKALLEELEKHVKLLPTFKEKPAQSSQTPKEQEEEERHLTEEEIEKLNEILAEHFIEGQRQNLILYLAGFLRKELNVSIDSIYKLYERLQTADDPGDIKARLAAIEKTFGKDLENIAGKSKLEEILSKETANELVNKIKQALNVQKQKPKSKKKKDDKILDEEVLEQLYKEMQNEETEQQNQPQDYVFVEINRKSRKFARCNYRNLTIEYGAFEKNEFLNKYVYVVHHKVFDCCIDKIYAIENPLTQEKKYEIHFISKNPSEPHTKLQGDIQEIWEGLKKTLYIFNSSVAQNVLTAVIAHYLKQGWYEKKREDLPPGFYYLDGELTASGFEEKEYTKEELQKAALFLNEYIYSHPNPLLIASIIKAGLLLPFSFAQKQMVLAGKLRKRMKYLYLSGQTKSGKTTTAMLLSRIWETDNKISYASFCTEARAAKHLSSSTHIIIVDEVNKDLETSTVKELLKYAQEDIMARIILSKAQKQIHYPALSAIIMTSNSHFPEDPALLERFIVFRFRKLDKISATDRTKYEKEDFRKLEPLGQFVWNYVKRHGLKDDYIEYVTEILKAAYQEAEVHGEWLDWAFIDDTAETEEEQEYQREAEFFTAVQRFFNYHVKPREGMSYARVVWEAIKSGQFGRLIWVDDFYRVYITKEFLLELKKVYRCEIRDLEELAGLTGWEKKQKRYTSDKNIRVWAIETSAMDFFFRMRYAPKLFMSSHEFEEWLAGRLKVKYEVVEEDVEEPLNDIPF